MKSPELCDRCSEPIAERVALLPGALALHAVATAVAWLRYWRTERTFSPNYCKDCVGLYNFYFAALLGVLAVLILILAVIAWS